MGLEFCERTRGLVLLYDRKILELMLETDKTSRADCYITVSYNSAQYYPYISTNCEVYTGYTPTANIPFTYEGFPVKSAKVPYVREVTVAEGFTELPFSFPYGSEHINYIEKLTLPASIEDIPKYLFYEYGKLAEIKLGSSVQSM